MARSALADAMREKDRQRMAALAPEARMDLALEMGFAAAAEMAAAEGVTLKEAIARIRAENARGRRHSACMAARRG
jgi:hypothetical protein